MEEFFKADWNAREKSCFVIFQGHHSLLLLAGRRQLHRPGRHRRRPRYRTRRPQLSRVPAPRWIHQVPERRAGPWHNPVWCHQVRVLRFRSFKTTLGAAQETFMYSEQITWNSSLSKSKRTVPLGQIKELHTNLKGYILVSLVKLDIILLLCYRNNLTGAGYSSKILIVEGSDTKLFWSKYDPCLEKAVKTMLPNPN